MEHRRVQGQHLNGKQDILNPGNRLSVALMFVLLPSAPKSFGIIGTPEFTKFEMQDLDKETLRQILIHDVSCNANEKIPK